MKEMLKMLGVMTAFSLVSGLLLAWTNSATVEPIARARAAERLDALKAVLPQAGNDMAADARTVRHEGRDWTFYVGRKGGAFAGAAFEAQAEGYGGPILLMAAVDAGGALCGVRILLADRETPGLGSKIREAAFLDQFRGRKGDPRWAAVRKDGGDVEAVTGATISSRAVVRAVKSGLEALQANWEHVQKAPESAPAAADPGA